MLREGMPIGAITVARAEAAPFSDKQIALLQTFADQAVIAIENVRLFKELQTSNRELTTALDTQTATSEILRVISQSQTDVQPVFGAIAESALRLLRRLVRGGLPVRRRVFSRWPRRAAGRPGATRRSSNGSESRSAPMRARSPAAPC